MDSHAVICFICTCYISVKSDFLYVDEFLFFSTNLFQLSSCIFILAEFIEGVSQFSVRGDEEQKLRCKLTCQTCPY